MTNKIDAFLTRVEKTDRDTVAHIGTGEGKADDNFWSTRRLRQNQKDIRKLIEIVRALYESADIATDLMGIPERNQDEEWSDKSREAYDLLQKAEKIVGES